MSILTRQLPVAAVAAVAMCAGAAPALAAPQPSSTTAAKAKTPLVTKIEARADRIRFRYQKTGQSIEAGLGYSGRTSTRTIPVADTCWDAAGAVERTPADAAQLMAKREWVLGVYMEARGDYAVANGDRQLGFRHQTVGSRAISEGLADWSLSNYFVAQADASLGIPHPARNIEPYPSAPGVAAPSGPGTVRTPTGLVATIAMGASALQEVIPDQVQNSFVDLNEAAVSYYSGIVAGMHVDGAQRPGRQDWLKGVQTLLRGDELLSRGESIHATGNPATGNREMRDALGILREANSEIAHADALLGVHTSGPSATLPSHVTYYKG